MPATNIHFEKYFCCAFEGLIHIFWVFQKTLLLTASSPATGAGNIRFITGNQAFG
jgi:hypothetical protein